MLGTCDTLGSPVPPVNPEPNSPEDSVALKVKVEIGGVFFVLGYLEVGTKEEYEVVGGGKVEGANASAPPHWNVSSGRAQPPPAAASPPGSENSELST